ncbi:MAG: SMC-Scp complex subunit ScpB [Deltaproteobacteria bacterium]|nr:SMC-Scp complex subunit ScpB [Deltaproteobacteria bacterium]
MDKEVVNSQKEIELVEATGDQEEEGSLDTITEETLSPIVRVCALLFVAQKPIKFETIKSVTRLSVEETEGAINQACTLFNDDTHGFSLHEVGGGYQFRTAPGAAMTIKRYRPPRQRRLSKAAAETLAVIAYKQPIQRTEIENIRGVDALPTLKTLLDNKLIRIVGHEDSVGQPALYGTTEEFLEVFGLSDLSQLPSLRELTDIASDPGEVGTEPAETEEIESTESSSEDENKVYQ